MKINNELIYLHQLDDHKCPRCSEPLDRLPRRLWQKMVSFALPFRHYQCSGCNRHFLALSPSWNGLPVVEKILRITVTILVFLAAWYALFRIILIFLRPGG